VGERVVFTGSFSGTLQLGDFELEASGGSDVFVASVGLSSEETLFGRSDRLEQRRDLFAARACALQPAGER
jgi:hypothetical protein